MSIPPKRRYGKRYKTLSFIKKKKSIAQIAHLVFATAQSQNKKPKEQFPAFAQPKPYQKNVNWNL